LSDYIIGNAVTAGIPSRRDLTSDCTAECEGFWDEDDSALFELCKPLPSFTCPDVAFVSVLKFELLGLRFRYLDRFKVMQEFNLLVEDFLSWIVTAEKLRF